MADIVVSDTISDFSRPSENLGQPVHKLKQTFCFEKDTTYEVSNKNRTSWVRPKPFLICNESERGEAIGGELPILLEFMKKDVIVIKGVADYGDGNEEWQFTAAKAALYYAELQLLNANLQKLFQGEQDSTFHLLLTHHAIRV